MKHILITGASRGIGLETAKSLTDAGHKVTVTARSGDALDKLKEYAPRLIDCITADLTKKPDIVSIAEYLQNNHGTLDGLIHNAGILINKPFNELKDNDWQQMLDVNLMGPVRLTRALVKRMKTGSHIVNISSMGGYQESSKFPGLSGYSATKGALTILTECLAKELKNYKINVNCLCLGAVQTEMLEEAFPGLQAPVSPAAMGNYIADFILDAHHLYNGKILPVALSEPE